MYIKTLFLGLPLAMMSLTSFAGEFESACEALLAKPSINMEILPVSVEPVSQALTATELTKVHYKGVNHGSVIIAGHTQVSWRPSSGGTLSSMTHPQTGVVCYRPAIVNLRLGFAPIKVFVASEYEADSCSYKAVLAHEMEHVRIYTDSLPSVAKSTAYKMAQAIGLTVRYASSAEAAKKEMDEFIHSTFHSLTVLANEMVQVKHNEFDSPEESHRMAHSCFGQVRSKLRFPVLAKKN